MNHDRPGHPTPYDRGAVSSPTLDPTDEQTVDLRAPALPAYARIVRLAATGLAARLGHSYDDVEELRIGVGEICKLLIEGDGKDLEIRFTISPSAIGVRARLNGSTSPLRVDDLSLQILVTVLDDVAIDHERALIEATLKRATSR